MTQISFYIFPSSSLYSNAELKWSDFENQILVIPSYLKNSVLMSDFGRLLKQNGVQMNIQYSEADYATIVKQCTMNNILTLGPLQTEQSGTMRYVSIKEMEYPYVICVHQEDADRLKAVTSCMYKHLRAAHRKQKLSSEFVQES